MCHKEPDQVAFGEGLERRGVQQSIAFDTIFLSTVDLDSGLERTLRDV